MCYYNGIRVSKEEFIRLKNMEVQINNQDLYCPVMSGFDDWRLPVKDDLLKVFNSRTFISNLPLGNYWTSQLSKEDEKGAYVINFYNGYTYTEYRETTVHICFVRKF